MPLNVQNQASGVVEIVVSQRGTRLLVPQAEYERMLSGIQSPQARQLSPGTKLYRAADQRDLQGTRGMSDGRSGSTVDAPASNWWCGSKAFNKIMEYCVQLDKDERGLGYAFREACAVLFEWGSSCDVLVEAVVSRPMWIFYGPGQPKSGTLMGTQYEFSGWSDIEQWFIPNITERVEGAQGGKHTRLTEAANSSIQPYRTVAIQSLNLLSESYKSAGQ